MKSIASLLVLLLTVFFITPAHAYLGQQGYCQQAQSTADLVACIGDHYKDETEQLNDLYSHVEVLYQDHQDYLSDVKDGQDQWLAYRKRVCDFEGDLYEGGSLQRVQELSCLARITENRKQHFVNIISSFDETVIPEFSYPPRWVNVLRNDYANVFWRFSSRQMMDTDCDGQDEEIIQGLEEVNKGDYKMVMVVSDSEQVGRPQMTVIRFDDQKDCQIKDDYQLIKLPTPKPDSEGDAPQCTHYVEIQTENCGNYILANENDTYSLRQKKEAE